MKKLALAFAALAAGAVSLTGCEKNAQNRIIDPPPPPVSRTYSVTVLSPSSGRLAGATVLMQTRAQNFVANTGSDGVAHIEIPNSVALPAMVVLVATHSSIMPQATQCSGQQSSSSSATLSTTALPSNYLGRDVYLHHLGNDLYGGDPNSQLQIPTEGTSITYTFSLSSIPNSMPRLRLFARGVQYPAEIRVNGQRVNTLGNSSSDGSLSFYNFSLGGSPRNVLHTGANTLMIKTASLASSSDPWDDIEFCGLMLY